MNEQFYYVVYPNTQRDLEKTKENFTQLEKERR